MPFFNRMKGQVYFGLKCILFILLTHCNEQIEKLRRILVSYCVHVNPGIGYCQSMNFIAGLLLVVFNGDEGESLKGLISIVDYYFPSNYFDHQLTGE